jgi:TRAP-type C4-dicarboxylate transport system permease large subunit
MKSIPLRRIYGGLGPYLAADFTRLALIAAFPVLSLMLPRWLGYM